jgi:hypothetical protein
MVVHRWKVKVEPWMVNMHPLITKLHAWLMYVQLRVEMTVHTRMEMNAKLWMKMKTTNFQVVAHLREVEMVKASVVVDRWIVVVHCWKVNVELWMVNMHPFIVKVHAWLMYVQLRVEVTMHTWMEMNAKLWMKVNTMNFQVVVHPWEVEMVKTSVVVDRWIVVVHRWKVIVELWMVNIHPLIMEVHVWRIHVQLRVEMTVHTRTEIYTRPSVKVHLGDMEMVKASVMETWKMSVRAWVIMRSCGLDVHICMEIDRVRNMEMENPFTP